MPAIFMIDADGKIVSWSDGAAICYGHRPREIIGQRFERTYSPVDRVSGQPADALAIARTRGRFQDLGWRVRKDGSRLWAHVTINGLRDEWGDVVGFAISTRDLTSIQRSAGLLDKVKTLDLALNNMSPGLVMFDADERVCFWNARWKLLVPSAVPLLRGARFVDVIRSSLECQGLDPRSDSLAAAVEAERERHLERLARAGEAAVCEEVRVAGRRQIHRHRAIPEGGWITTIEEMADIHVPQMGQDA